LYNDGLTSEDGVAWLLPESPMTPVDSVLMDTPVAVGAPALGTVAIFHCVEVMFHGFDK
jgi:hypothetical protein